MVGHKNFPQKEIPEKFPQKSCSGMGKGNSYHAHVSYPDCRIFLSHIPSIRRKKKNNVFITFSPLLFLTSSTLCLESASIQKYLYKRCNFHFPSPPPRAQKLKFHRRTLGNDGNLHISQTSIQIFR